MSENDSLCQLRDLPPIMSGIGLLKRSLFRFLLRAVFHP